MRLNVQYCTQYVQTKTEILRNNIPDMHSDGLLSIAGPCGLVWYDAGRVNRRSLVQTSPRAYRI